MAGPLWKFYVYGEILADSEKNIVKIHPRTGHEGSEWEQVYRSTLPSTSALDVGGWSTSRSGRFTPSKNPATIV